MSVKVMIPDELASRLRSEGRVWGRRLTQEVLYRLNTWTLEGHERAIRGPLDVPLEVKGPLEGHQMDIRGTLEGQLRDTRGPLASNMQENMQEVEETPLQRAEMLDMLLDDGDPKSVKSNFQIRRKKQIEFLTEQWTEMFPGNRPLLDTTAKTFLQLSGDSVQEVFEAFGISAQNGINGNGTVGYVTKVLKNRAEKAKQPVQAEKPTDGKHPWDSEPTLRAPTEADYAEWAEAKRLWELTERDEGRRGDNT